MVVVLGDEMDDARIGHVGVGPPELFRRHVFPGDALDHRGAGDEHLRLAGLDDEVGQGGAVGRAAGAGAADERNLRHGAREHDVVVEDLSVAGEGIDPFLHAGAAGIVDEDEGGAGFQGLCHDLGDLYGVDLAGRTAGDGKVLAGQVHQAAVDGGRPGHHAVGGVLLLRHSEHDGTVLGKQAHFLEAVRVHQGLDPLARRQFPLLALLFKLVCAAPQHGFLAPLA